MPSALPNDRNARLFILQLRAMDEPHATLSAETFLTQWYQIRGPWEREDWLDRIEATIRFYEDHAWNGVRWLQRNAM